MATIQELIDQRLAIINQAKAINDAAEKEGRDLTAEEAENFKKAHADAAALKNRADRLHEQRIIDLEHESLVTKVNQPHNHGLDRSKIPASAAGDFDAGARADNPKNSKPTEKDRSMAFAAWCLYQLGKTKRITDEHKLAAKKCGANLNKSYFDFRLKSGFMQRQRGGFYNAMSTTTDTGGGYTVPQGFMANFENAMLQFGSVQTVADVITTASGNPMPWPTVDDTSSEGEMLGNNIETTEGDVTVGAMTLNAYKISSKLVLVSFELMQDSGFDIAGWVGEQCGERVGRGMNRKLTTGSGAAEPYGIVNSSTNGVTAASATAFTFDELYSLKHSVDVAYRQGAGWMMHDSILLAIKKLKDGNGRYLFQASTSAGAPDTIDSDPISVNNHMASSVATTAKTVLYGNFRKYKVRRVAGIRVRHLVERYAEKDQDGFVAFLRFDGNLLDAGTHPIKHLAQA